MKNPLQTLLIAFALGLCTLCSWQWYSQVLQQKQLDAVAQQNYDQAGAIQGYTNSIAALDRQVSQLDARLTELRESAKSNSLMLATLRTENNRLNVQVGQYSNAVAQLQTQLTTAYDKIRHQNETVKTLAQERDDFVKRLNDSIRDRNVVVDRYNELVKQVEALQAAQPKK